MGSVGVTWSGTCRVPPLVPELVRYLRRLADASHARRNVARFAWTEDESGRARRTIVVPETTWPEVYDGRRLAGRVAVWPTVLDHETRSTVPLWTDDVVLDGIVFRLFDPRELYDDEVSFLFARTPREPLLRGHMVAIIPGAELENVRRPELFAGADHVLVPPGVHLRYLYERWLDGLLAWLKLFFVPDLWYWRYDDLPGFSSCAPERFRPSRLVARDRMFDELAEGFRRELDAAWF